MAWILSSTTVSNEVFSNNLPLMAQVMLATSMRVSLPFAVLNVFEEDSYQGGPLLTLPQSGLVKAPTAHEISLNYVWMLPVVRAWPAKARLLDVLPVKKWYHFGTPFLCKTKTHINCV